MNKLNFSDYNNVLCDSLDALDWAYENGLSKNISIRTSSPALLFNKNINTTDLTARWKTKDLKRFQESINDFSKNIFLETLQQNPLKKEYCLLISQTAVNFHKVIYKAACLNNTDLTEKILILNVKGKFGNKNLNINSPWSDLLKSNKNINEKILFSNTQNNKKPNPKTFNLWSRIRFGGFETLCYRIIIKYLNKFLSIFFYKQALIMGENELIIESMFKLALKGVCLKELQINTNTSSANNYLSEDTKLYFNNIKKLIMPLLILRLQEWLDKDLIEPCTNLFFENLLIQLQAMDMYKGIAIKELNKINNKKTVLVTSNHINNKVLAVLLVCKKYGIPIISFQHGVTPEICDTTKEISVSHPVNNVDKFIVFNKQSAIYAENEAYIKSSSFVAGLPKRYFKSIKKINNINPNHKIIFLSMHLYRGNIGGIKCNYTDNLMAINELYIIKNILNKLPHKVYYKAYPQENKRYPDEDPVLKLLPKYKNLILINKDIDARYLLESFRIIVTGHASSTISWAIMSKKPIIFINNTNNSPLSERAMKDFKKSLFVFNANDINFEKDIINFLSQKIETIEKMYMEMERHRDIMIDQFVTSYSQGAGARSANIIFKEYLSN